VGIRPAFAESVREVTEDEAAFYREHGWVVLRNLIDPATAARLLSILKGEMGDHAERKVADGFDAKLARAKESQAIFQLLEDASSMVPELREFVTLPEIGAIGMKLVGGPVGLWLDTALVKLPAASGGGKTPWHQDWPYYPLDRMGTLTIWIALVDMPPEKGTLQFVDGSHRWGPHGRVIHRTDGVDSLDLLPVHLREAVHYSPPLHLRAGDATVLDLMTIHAAPENLTDTPRWVYTIILFPSEALYTGAPNRRTENLQLALNEPLAHERFYEYRS
jgi:ectoine hydroxylase-related dioxygenase (phytanoyl-CoA dioxygenase family)